MKSDRYQRRFYRDWRAAKDLRSAFIMAKETDLQVLTDKKLDEEFVKEQVRRYRWDIEDYIDRDRRFLVALKPINVEIDAPLIVKAMSEAAKIANVGPMASVAGAVAEFLGRDLLKKGYKNVIIENGGDIFLKSSRPRVVGIYSGKSKLWRDLGIKIKPKDTPIGICTSSGTLGHSLNFGSADSVVILSKNTLLADCVATATCNRINSKADLEGALSFARSVRGVSGVVLIFKNNLVSWGKIELTR